MKKCFRCNFEIENEDYNFCPYCGGRLDDDGPKRPTPLSQEEFIEAMTPFEYKYLPEQEGYKLVKVKSKFINSAVIPRGVVEIGYAAFRNCKSLLTVTIPDTVTLISHTAFPGCDKLQHVIFTGDKGQWNSIDIGNENAHLTLNRITYLGEAPSKDGDDEDEDYERLLSPFATKLTNDFLILTEVKDKSVKEITVPGIINSLAEEAFKDCDSLESVTITGPIIQIPRNAFSDCKNLKRVVIPDTVRRIKSYAFYNCVSLDSIFLSSELSGIDYSAFEGCTSLANVYTPNTKKEWKHVSIDKYAKGNKPLLKAKIHFKWKD